MSKTREPRVTSGRELGFYSRRHAPLAESGSKVFPDPGFEPEIVRPKIIIPTSIIPTKASIVLRGVRSIDTTGLPDDHILVDTDLHDNAGFLRAISLFSKADARKVAVVESNQPLQETTFEDRLNKCIRSFPRILEGYLGKADVFGKLDDPRARKYVGYGFREILGERTAIEAGRLTAAAEIPLEPQAVHLNVAVTRSLAQAEDIKGQLNTEPYLIGIELDRARVKEITMR